MAALLPVEQIRIARTELFGNTLAELRIRRPKINERCGIVIRQRMNKNCVHQAKDGGNRADAEGRYQNRDGGESRLPPHLAAGETNILNELGYKTRDAHVARVFKVSGLVTETAAGLFARLPGGQTFTARGVFEHGEVCIELLLQFAIQPAGRDAVPDAREKAHASVP